MNKRVHITVSGRVQGVFFRAYTQKKAMELGLKGYVKNMRNGSVFIDVEGADTDLKIFQDWCLVGSPISIVEHCDITTIEELANYTGFDIKR
jgi:acylphosphatase